MLAQGFGNWYLMTLTPSFPAESEETLGAMNWRKWVWFLLPKQKGLVAWGPPHTDPPNNEIERSPRFGSGV